MTTQYTTILKLALPVQGELSGTWGDVVNDNITQMVEQAVAGKAVINTWTGNSHTLTTADGTTSESRCAILELTDSGTALTGAGTVVCPTNTKLYIVDNNTAEIVTVKTSGGTGVAVPVGKTMLVYCDGTNVVEGVTHANSLSLGTSTVTADKILDEDNMASDSATAIATQQSIKAYVDSQVGTVDTLAEVLAQGNTTGGTDIAVGTGDDITFADNSKAIFGADSDLQIYHSGSNSYIVDSGTGSLYIQGSSNILLGSTTQSNLIIADGGAVTARYAGDNKLVTTATGIDVTGTVTADSLATNDDVSGISTLGRYSSGFAYSLIRPSATATGIEIRTNAGNALAHFLNDGTTTLHHNGSAKLTTLSTGIDVTGSVTADGLTVVAADAALAASIGSNEQRVYITPNGTEISYNASGDAAGSHMFQTGNIDRLNIASNGDLSLYEDTGTTPKFFWDASAEALGIGTSSPAAAKFSSTPDGVLNLSGDKPVVYLTEEDETDSNVWMGLSNEVGIIGNTGVGLAFRTGASTATEAMRIVDSGLVGIGTELPSSALEVSVGVTQAIADTDDAVDVLTLSAPEEGNANLVSGNGPALKFKIPGNTNASYDGARIAAKKVSAADTNNATNLSFSVNANVDTSESLTERLLLTYGGAITTYPVAGNHFVINENGFDADFRVESDSNTHAIYMNAANNTTSFGGATPATSIGFIGAGGIYINNGNQPSGDFMSIDAEGASGATKMTFYRYDSSATTYHNRFAVAGETSETVVNESGVDVDFRVESDGNANMIFVDASANFVALGNNTANPASGFAATGGVGYSSGGGMQIANNTSGASLVLGQNFATNGSICDFRKQSTIVGSISVTGAATAYNTSSDQRLKENIVDAPDAGDLIDAIQVRQFDWIVDGEHQRYGMVAQELNTVAPEAVSAPEDPDEMMGVDYSKLVPMLIKEIQSLRARVADLES